MSAATGEGASPLRTVGPGHSRVTVVGRGKDLIISAGYDVCPAGIEGCVNELPGVAESAVVGVPQPDFGEAAVAVVVPKPGATVDGLRLGLEPVGPVRFEQALDDYDFPNALALLRTHKP